MTAKLVTADGTVTATRSFTAEVDAPGDDAASAVKALDAAFGNVAKELVPWVMGNM
jgi:ABC-type uncharacterized transport system auxiliary subunit